MKRHVLSGLLAAGLVGLIGQAASAQTVLRFDRWVPPTHHFHTQIMQPWADEIAKVTEGRVKVEFTSAALGPPTRQFDLALNGVADITASNHAYTASRFPLTEMVELPFVGDQGEALSVAYWRVYNKMFLSANEHRGVKLITLFVNGPGHLFNNKKAVTALADAKGLKLRVQGGVTNEIAKKLDAVPVAVPATQVYETLSNGVADGAFFTSDAYRSFKLEKLLSHVTKFPGSLYTSSFFVVMNQKKWDELSPQDQKAIDAISGEAFARKAGATWDRNDALGETLMKETGIKEVVAQGELLASMKQALAPLEAEWIEKAKKSGVDGVAALKMLREEFAKLKK